MVDARRYRWAALASACALLLATRIAMAQAPGDSLANMVLSPAATAAKAFARVADNSNLELTSVPGFTVEAWVEASSSQPYTSFPVALSKPTGNRSNGDANYAFVFTSATGHLDFRVTTSAGTFNATCTTNLLDNHWHHLAGVVSPDSSRLYVDGQPVARIVLPGAVMTSSDSLSIGALTFDTPEYEGNWMVGGIDEVRIWNRPLSQTEIQSQMGLVITWAPNLVGSWHFDHVYAVPGVPCGFGAAYYMESSRGDLLESGWPIHGTSLTSVSPGPPISRGSGLRPLCREVVGSEFAQGVVTLGTDSTQAVFNEYRGYCAVPSTAYLSDLGECAVVNASALAGSGGAAAIRTQTGAPAQFTPMAVRDSIVFTCNAAETHVRAAALRESPGEAVFFSDSVAVCNTPVAMMVDSLRPQYLYVLGDQFQVEGSTSCLEAFDVSNPSAMTSVATLTLPTSAQAFALAQFQKYLFVSSSDSLRVYLFDQGAFTMITDYPPQLGQLTPIAISGKYSYQVSPLTGIFWIEDLSGFPKVRVIDSELNLAPLPYQQIVVRWPWAYVLSYNGIQVINVSDPGMPVLAGSYVPDFWPVGAPALAVGPRSEVFLAAGPAGYYELQNRLDCYPCPTGVDDAPARPWAGLVVHPNPSFGHSSARFDLPRGGMTTLEIFDVAGRRVRRLVDGSLVAGPHVVDWDGRGDAGSRVPAGVYLWRVRSGATDQTFRVVLLR